MKLCSPLFCLFSLLLPVSACGPWLPDSLLLLSNEAFLEAPQLGFVSEMRQWLPATRPPAQPPISWEQELQSALRATGVGEDQALHVEAQVRAFREALAQGQRSNIRMPKAGSGEEIPTLRLLLQSMKLSEEVPAEFRLYLEGKRADLLGDGVAASAAWEQLLRLPGEQRPARTVMAAYQLARSSMKEADCKRVGDYVRKGFADRHSLEAAILGWQAQQAYFAGEYGEALDLYLQQWGSPGGKQDRVSLSWVARDAFAESDDEQLSELLTDPVHRGILTAYLLSLRPARAKVPQARLRRLLKVKRLRSDEAGRFARLAYQQNDLSAAKSWIRLAEPEDALALWVQAKLWLRGGNLEKGKAVMLALTGELQGNPENLKRMDTQRAWAELALLQMEEGEFSAAALSFWNAGAWMDCAYLLERVLSIEQGLQQIKAFAPRREAPPWWEKEAAASSLLARRLMREGNYELALTLFPEELQGAAQRFVKALRDAEDEQAPAEDRAKAYWVAAGLQRWWGMELFGTELAPDFALFDGQYQLGDLAEARKGPREGWRFQMQENERRLAAATALPEARRFHYRYDAAALAAAGADLLPRHHEEAAKLYWQAGSWLKRRDPKAADLYFKQLATRTRHTRLGGQAEELNWFPQLVPNQTLPFDIVILPRRE